MTKPSETAKTAEHPDPKPEVKPEPAPTPKDDGAMAYLGTLVTPGALAGGKPATGALPLVVRDKTTKRIIGVAVVSDPSWSGATLDACMKQAGHKGPFEQVSPSMLDAAGKTACARAIVAQRDPALDVDGALAAFGFQRKMLGL